MVGIGERVRYVGDALAIVAAETPGDRRAGVGVDRSGVRPPACHHESRSGASGRAVPQLHEKGNLLKHIKVRKGDMDAGFAEADVILEHTFHTPIN